MEEEPRGKSKADGEEESGPLYSSDSVGAFSSDERCDAKIVRRTWKTSWSFLTAPDGERIHVRSTDHTLLTQLSLEEPVLDPHADGDDLWIMGDVLSDPASVAE